MRKVEPKHTIHDSEAFQKGREILGGLISKDMITTGGTDIDWLIEHRGGFLFCELKQLHNDLITIPVGQMIAFQKLHEALNKVAKCYFFFFGTDAIDFKNPESLIYYFEMEKWNDKSIPHQKSQTQRWYIVERKDMQTVNVGNFRKMIESFWREFEKSS